MTSAIDYIHRLCGPIWTNCSNNITIDTPLARVCGHCHCSPDCVLSDNCCPSYILRLPETECINKDIYHSHKTRKVPATFGYKFVKTCPLHAAAVIKSKCLTNRNLTERLKTLPVTSYDRYITYDNEYCARCNNDNKSLQPWALTIRCNKNKDFNMLNTFEDIAKTIIDGIDCSVSTNMYSSSGVAACTEHPQVAITKCNQTGTWYKKSQIIETACSAIDQPFGMFRNIFCYICNPPIGIMDPIDSCPYNEDTQITELCKDTSHHPETYPYKNRHCYVCSVNISTEIITHIQYKKPINGGKHTYYLLSRYCREEFKLGIYSPFLISSLNTNADIEDTLPNPTYYKLSPGYLLIFSTQGQYEIECSDLEVFSLLYSIQQLILDAVSRNCTVNDKTFQSPLKCFRKSKLKRDCQGNPGYVQAVFETLKHACLFIEHERLTAYKEFYNIFCYLCNEHANLNILFCNRNEDLMYLNVDSSNCTHHCNNNINIKGIVCQLCSTECKDERDIRSMFVLSSYATKGKTDDSTKCSSIQMYDSAQVCIFYSYFTFYYVMM